jgi:hypothetical protein
MRRRRHHRRHQTHPLAVHQAADHHHVDGALPRRRASAAQCVAGFLACAGGVTAGGAAKLSTHRSLCVQANTAQHSAAYTLLCSTRSFTQLRTGQQSAARSSLSDAPPGWQSSVRAALPERQRCTCAPAHTPNSALQRSRRRRSHLWAARPRPNSTRAPAQLKERRQGGATLRLAATAEHHHPRHPWIQRKSPLWSSCRGSHLRAAQPGVGREARRVHRVGDHPHARRRQRTAQHEVLTAGVADRDCGVQVGEGVACVLGQVQAAVMAAAERHSM